MATTGPAKKSPRKTSTSSNKQTFFGSSATNWSEFLFGTSKSRAQLGKDLLSYGGMRGFSSPLSGGRNVIDTSRALGAMRATRTGVSTVAKYGKGKPSNPVVVAAAKKAVAKKTTPSSTAQYPNLPRTSRKTATGQPYTTAEMRAAAAASKGNYRVAGGAAAAGGLMAIGAANARGRTTRQAYSGMKPGAEKVRTGPGGAYVGSGMGAKARPKTGGSYVGSTVGGNTGSRKAPSTPSSSGGGGGKPRQTGPSKKQVQARRAAITDLLSKAEAAAAAGNIQAAANFSAAALNRQKAGQGSAASMQRMKKVARTYSKAAGRTKVENQEAGRVRLGKPPVRGKKG